MKNRELTLMDIFNKNENRIAILQLFNKITFIDLYPKTNKNYPKKSLDELYNEYKKIYSKQEKKDGK